MLYVKIESGLEGLKNVEVKANLDKESLKLRVRIGNLCLAELPSIKLFYL